MNGDFDEYQQSNVNQAESELDLQEEQHFFINYQSLKQDIAFYLLTLIQILFVFITKFAFNNSEQDNSISENTDSQNIQQNNDQNISSNKSQIIWSTLNIVILMATISSFIYSITIYKKRLKKIYYTFNSILNYLIILLMSGYIFAKPSPNQNIFFIEQSTPIEKIFEGDQINEQTEIYDLYFILMLTNKIQNHSELQVSMIFKIMLHITIIVIQFNKTSIKGYIPIALCVIQYIIYDILQIIWIRNQQINQILFCQCFEQKCPHSNENLQNQFSPQMNRLQNSGINQFSHVHQINTDGTIFNELSSLKHIPLSLNHSFCLKNFNNISKVGLIGKKFIQIENCNSAQLANKDKPKKTKKVNTFSSRSFWNKKSQIKQSGDFNQSDEKWQSYLNQIPSGILLIKKNLDQVKFANEFIKQFFLKNFQKLNDEEILDMILRKIEFKILSHVVSHISNEKKRITRFSSSVKKQIRESISNAEKKQGKRINSNANNEVFNNSKNDLEQNNNDQNKNSMKSFPVFSNSRNNSNQEDQNSQKSPAITHQTNHSINGQNINQIDQTKCEKTTLETILINFDQSNSQRDIENSTLEIYAKVVNVVNKESISIKGKVLYRSEGDEFLIIIEDNTNFENVTNLADRDDYKNRLISSFSHELRTPLNSSMGFLQSALLDDLINQEVKDTYLTPAYQSLKLQYYFINDILDFSQILAKKDLQLNFIKFHITKLICDIKELYQNSFASKEISLQFQVDTKVQNWEICTDYDRLMQILVNLINNSLRFTLKGGVTIKINPTIQNNLSIYVIDTGEGMNMLQFEQIKEKLASFGMTGVPITETQHTGFGLTISQIIVSILASESNQDLEIKKTQGGGCTFSFCIENILNLQASYSTSHNNSKMDILKTGSRALIRKDTKKQTYAHRSIEKQSTNKPLQHSSQSLYAKQNQELKRVGSASISRIDNSKTPRAGTYRAQASAFKKNQHQQLSELTISNHMNQQIKADEIPEKKQLDLQLIIKKEIKDKYFRSNSMHKYHMNLSQNESPKQFHEVDQNFINEQIKTQPLFQMASPTNNAEDGMQISGFNFINQQNSSYSQQKRFFINQSQAMLTSYNNILLQKEKSFKNYENEFEDIQQSLLQSDSIISHTDCFEEKLQQYNFNKLIHPNGVVFTSPVNQVNSPVQKQNFVGQVLNQSEKKCAKTNSVLINISNFDNTNKQGQSQNFALSSIHSDIFNQITESIETSMHLSQKFVDNVSTSAQIPIQDKSYQECIVIQSPQNNQNNNEREVEIICGTQLNSGEKQFKYNINSNQSIQTNNSNNENFLLIKNNNIQDIKKPYQPTKAIIVTPGSKRQTPHRQNSVKFCFQTECKAASDKEVNFGSVNSPSSQQQEQIKENKGDFKNLSPNNNENSFGAINEVLIENDQVNEDNINKIVQNLISFDIQKQKQQKNDTQYQINNIQGQNINNEISQSNAYQNNLVVKPFDNINQLLQNPMQLSEQFSEFSWQNPQNFQNGIQYNQLIHSAMLNKKSQASSSASSQQINQNIYFNIGRMRQIIENSNSPQIKFMNTQNNESNDTETANFNIQKETSNLNNFSKQQINSIQFQKDFIKSENKIVSMKDDNQNNQEDLNKISIDERISKNEKEKIKGNVASLKNVNSSYKIINKNRTYDDQEFTQDKEGSLRKKQNSEIIQKSLTSEQQIYAKCNCKRVLCVDDEIFNLQVLLFLFKKLGYNIEKAFNGQEAINKFLSFYNQRTKYQCDGKNCTVFKAIILDCNMPIMNGWECAKQLRKLMQEKQLPSIPIIALTAYVAQQAHNQCIESGMDDVLNKPINIEVLQNTIENYIELYDLEQKDISHI